MKRIKTLRIVVGGGLLSIGAVGCMTTRSPSLVTLPEGYKIVAQGMQPIGFYLNQPGETIVTDLDTGNAVYSMDERAAASRSDAMSDLQATLKIEDGRLIAQTSDTDSTTILAGLDDKHTFRIVFRPAQPTTKPATMPVRMMPTAH